MRRDHYLPTLKRANKADRKPPGKLRRMLERIGPTMASAPLRRLIQTVCFITFLVSFFYVCWAYTAKPASTADTPATEAVLPCAVHE